MRSIQNFYPPKTHTHASRSKASEKHMAVGKTSFFFDILPFFWCHAAPKPSLVTDSCASGLLLSSFTGLCVLFIIIGELHTKNLPKLPKRLMLMRGARWWGRTVNWWHCYQDTLWTPQRRHHPKKHWHSLVWNGWMTPAYFQRRCSKKLNLGNFYPTPPVQGLSPPQTPPKMDLHALNGSDLFSKFLEVHLRKKIILTPRGSLKLGMYTVSSEDTWLILPVYQQFYVSHSSAPWARFISRAST